MAKIFLIILTLIFLTTSYVFAVEGRNGGDGRNGDGGDDRREDRVETRERQEIRRDDDRVRIEIRREVEDENEDEDDEERVEVKGNEFEIRGKITSVSENSFTVLDNTVFVDPALVSDFKQRGILNVGEDVRVKGVIVDNKKFAREIRVLGEDEEVRVEIKQTAQDEEQRVRIKARGPLDQVSDLLQQLLNFFRR